LTNLIAVTCLTLKDEAYGLNFESHSNNSLAFMYIVFPGIEVSLQCRTLWIKENFYVYVTPYVKKCGYRSSTSNFTKMLISRNIFENFQVE